MEPSPGYWLGWGQCHVVQPTNGSTHPYSHGGPSHNSPCPSKWSHTPYAVYCDTMDRSTCTIMDESPNTPSRCTMPTATYFLNSSRCPPLNQQWTWNTLPLM